MKKLFKKYPVFSGALLVLVFVALVAAIPTNIVRTFHLWVGSVTATPGNVTMGDGVGYFESNVEIDGVLYADGGISTSVGAIGATEIADITRSFDISVPTYRVTQSAESDASPAMALTDGVWKLVWASGELASVSYTFTVPTDYVSSLTFRLIGSTDTDTAAAGWGFDWGLFVNNAGIAFDATAYSQAASAATESSPSTKNAAFTLAADATAEADLAAGDAVTVFFFPYDVRVGGAGGGTTELLSIQAQYTATQ